MGTKGYMEHMKKVNKGLEYMYPNRGKGTPYTRGYNDGIKGLSRKECKSRSFSDEYYKGYEKGLVEYFRGLKKLPVGYTPSEY
tara:strand:+ start:2517 stop:2765 length:249 start_codon:yes stop_codon:yes gene_type:complete